MAHHVFRRGLVSGSPFAEFSETSPTLFAPMEFASTSADGQILYQDSAASTPVTTSGDPIGDIAWADNTVQVGQTTDASRPTFQTQASEPVGYADFDGSDDQILAGVGADFQYLNETGGTIFVVVQSIVSAGLIQRYLSTFNSSVGIVFDVDGDDVRLNLITSGGAEVVQWTNTISASTWHTLCVRYSPSDDPELFADGVSQGTRTQFTNYAAETPDGGASFGADPDLAFPLDGFISIGAVWDAVLTDAQISDLHDATGI